MNTRFTCASSALEPRILLRRGRAVWVAFLLALVVHPATTLVRARADQRTAPKPLTTQFVKRQPRLTKPLELKKRPHPKRRRVERKMVAVQARLERGTMGAGFQPMRVLSGLARPSARIGRLTGLADVEQVPHALAGVIEEAREPEHKIDMGLELLDIEAPNTGRYHAMVVQDPTDKRNISGFLNLAYIYSAQMQGPDPYRSADMNFYAITRLVERMNDWTQIKTRIAGRFTFDAAKLFQTPWVYTRSQTLSTWAISNSEAENLGRYLKRGGFWIADGVQAPGLGQDISMRNAVKDALATVDHEFGRDWDLQVMPFGHPIFHSFFEFPDGAPVSADEPRWGSAWAVNVPVEGVFLGERLMVLYTNKNLVHGWVGFSPLYPQYDFDGTRVFQFGINTIVFALTQEGSITHRLMESVQ